MFNTLRPSDFISAKTSHEKNDHATHQPYVWDFFFVAFTANKTINLLSVISLTVNVLTVEVLLGANKKKQKNLKKSSNLHYWTTRGSHWLRSLLYFCQRWWEHAVKPQLLFWTPLSFGSDPLCYQEGKQTIQILLFKGTFLFLLCHYLKNHLYSASSWTLNHNKHQPVYFKPVGELITGTLKL